MWIWRCSALAEQYLVMGSRNPQRREPTPRPLLRSHNAIELSASTARVYWWLEPDVGLLRHGARRHADLASTGRPYRGGDAALAVANGHRARCSSCRISVGLPNRHHHAEHPSPHTRVEHQTVIRAHARAPREATLSQNARPPLLDPARGKWAARVPNRLQPVSPHQPIVAAYSRWDARRDGASRADAAG
jgi:hypothetical protein